MKKYILCLLLSICLFSCSESEISTYDVKMKSSVLFIRESGTVGMGGTIQKINYADSLNVSFVGQDINNMKFIHSFPIVLVGTLPNEPIKLNFRVNDTLTTAIAGEDYEINLDTTYLMPNVAKASLRFIAKRTPKLLEKQVTLAIDLVESDEYDILAKYNNTNVWNDYTKVLSGKTFRINFGEMAIEPFYWKIFCNPYFGKWTAEKFRVVNYVMNWTIVNWDGAGGADSPVALGVFGYAAFQVRDYLQAKADADTPEREADGSLMQQPGIYAVDYSRYED